MSDLDTSQWRPLGQTSNTQYYEVSADILLAVPNKGSRDDLASAQENQAFQSDHWRRSGHGGVVVVMIDQMVEQTKDARGVYQASDPALMRATVLVGGNLLGRAMAAFFLGISKPNIPIKMFAKLPDALDWARQVNAQAAAPR